MTVTINNVTYTLTTSSSGNTASVTGNTLSTLTNVIIPSSITDTDGISYSVTSIGSSAFNNSSNLASVVIPDSVTIINNGTLQQAAFYHCSQLTSVTIGANVTSIGSNAFRDCSKLTAVTIPDAVTSIGDSAFFQCSQLTSVTIGNAVTSIGNNAFTNCNHLTSVTIGTGLTTMGSGAFQCYTDTLTSMYFLGDYPSGIDDYTFYSDNSLTLYYVAGATGWSSSTVGGRPAQAITTGTTGVASITAFSNSNKTASFSITDSNYTNVELLVLNGTSGVTSGKAFALSNGSWSVTSPALVNGDVVKVFLQTSSGATVTELLDYSATTVNGTTYYSVDLGVGIVSIGDDVFNQCYQLTSVTIGANVTSIGDTAFYSCNQLTSVTIPDAVTSIGTSAFNQCSQLTSVTIGNAVTSIGDSAFAGCTQLTSVTIPDAVTSIGTSAFYNCPQLTSVTIGNAVTSIGSSAFAGCTQLTSVTIGANVTTIGFAAFNSCGTTLTSMYFLGDYPSGIENGTFGNDTNLTLYYVAGATGWSTYDYATIGRPAYLIPTISSTTSSSVSISADSNLSTVYVYTSANSGTTWTINSVTMSSGSGSLPGLSSGTFVSTIANVYDATTYADYCKTITTPTPTPTSNVCFPAKTPVLTNQGPINIEDINPAVHTIRNKKIVAITKTVAHDKNLVRIAKHALGHLYPEKTTFISQNHKVFFQGQMVKAKHLVDEANGVTLVPYNGEALYNVLLEEHEKMQVNNLIVETLHPEHKVAKLYRFLKNVDAAHHGKLIALFNKCDHEQRLRR